MKEVNDIDELCIRRVLRGNREAFALLVDSYSRSVFDLVAAMVTQREDAEELAQDVFVRAYQKLDTFDGSKATFLTWISRIAYRLCIDYHRRKPAIWLETDEQTLRQISDTDADSVMDTDDEWRIHCLIEGIHRLPPTERMLVQQHYFEGRSLKDIAAIVDADASTLATRLHRIRKKLYHWIKSHEYGQ